jgi:hypothetical protein
MPGNPNIIISENMPGGEFGFGQLSQTELSLRYKPAGTFVHARTKYITSCHGSTGKSRH